MQSCALPIYGIHFHWLMQLITAFIYLSVCVYEKCTKRKQSKSSRTAPPSFLFFCPLTANTTLRCWKCLSLSWATLLSFIQSARVPSLWCHPLNVYRFGVFSLLLYTYSQSYLLLNCNFRFRFFADESFGVCHFCLFYFSFANILQKYITF